MHQIFRKIPQRKPSKRFLKKKLFLKILQYSQETPVFESLFKACNFIKKKLQHRRFPVNIAKFSETPISKNICERLFVNPINVRRNYIAYNIFQTLNPRLTASFISVKTQALKVFRNSSFQRPKTNS